MTTAILVEEQQPLARGLVLLPGYRVRRHLRRGRPYDVYEVHSDLRRTSCVAKVARPAAAGDSDAASQLIVEGSRLAALTHPHLVQVYEVLEDPVAAIIMETLGGQTLKFMIHDRGRPVDPEGLLHLGSQLCSAVGYLHRNGLLHLDLKPSNVVNDRGRVKLIDLSLARPAGSGVRCGTSQYLAPEQARGGALSTATDVWGVGVVLYEAITSRRPFDESTSGDYRQLDERRVLPRNARDRVAPALADLVDACLDPEPVRRPTLDQVEAVLDSLTRG